MVGGNDCRQSFDPAQSSVTLLDANCISRGLIMEQFINYASVVARQGAKEPAITLGQGATPALTWLQRRQAKQYDYLSTLELLRGSPPLVLNIGR